LWEGDGGGTGSRYLGDGMIERRHRWRSTRPIIRPGSGGPVNYERIKELAKELKRPAETLIALSPANDPFYVRPARQKLANWFAKLWPRLKLTGQVHIRRAHYVLVTRAPRNLAGVPFENTAKEWDDLIAAMRDVRYLDLLKLPKGTSFVDRRNNPPTIYLPDDKESPADVDTADEQPAVELSPEPMPSLPGLQLIRPQINQRFHIEIWCEKTTHDDILDPLAERLECNLITGAGEFSTTHCADLVKRALKSGRPVRILYISDHDPGGRSMPVAVARKIEFELYRLGRALDIQVRFIVLTPEQCEEYELPRTPIKEGERRAERFEERFGEGATELDALEALHPGALEDIVEEEIKRYYDDELEEKIDEVAGEVDSDLADITERVHADHQADIDRLEAAWDEMAERHAREREQWQEQAEPVWHAIADQLADQQPNLFDVEWPEPKEGDEDDDPLFDSTRDYLTQMDSYKKFQDKPTSRRGT
jgi:hypothetical protein